MTVRQEEYLTLFLKGYGIREIARMLDTSPGSVCSTIKRAMQPKKEKRATSIVCKYSPSCFTCPLPDYATDGYAINLLPLNFDYVKEVERE